MEERREASYHVTGVRRVYETPSAHVDAYVIEVRSQGTWTPRGSLNCVTA
jgi:hypothetical protein